MDKPKILTGEVKEFIDFVETKFMQYPDNIKVVMSTLEIKDFYSQKFRPEMVTEYFEGWELTAKIQPEFRNEDYSITFPIDRICIFTKKQFLYNSDEYYNHLLPKTLSQFITNAIQSGIKLKWKE